ncbi:hypothetical protein [Clostridium sp. LP20]|uniref:hypothetical protein n=1 Tax=Clostridium sp. LP20 TaxID=3418665 RepID=UPI003EE5934F
MWLVQAVIFFIVLCIGYTIGRTSTRARGQLNEVTSEEDDKKEIRLKEMNEGMANIMNYDLDVAMGTRGDMYE